MTLSISNVLELLSRLELKPGPSPGFSEMAPLGMEIDSGLFCVTVV